MLADYPTATRYCSIESSPLRTRPVKNATSNPSFVIQEWIGPSIEPGDGDSIWIAVREWSGHIHVDYAQTFVDVDGLMIHRYEGEKCGYGEQWPPKDVIAWKLCDTPEFPG